MDKKGFLKICDFGISCYEKDEPSGKCGSPIIYAPEMIKNEKYNRMIDYWAVGIILYDMLYDDHPF